MRRKLKLISKLNGCNYLIPAILFLSLFGFPNYNYALPNSTTNEECFDIADVLLEVDSTFSDTTYLFQSSCDSADVGIYETIFIGQGGCDSVVIAVIDFLPSSLETLAETTCDPSEVGTYETLLTNQFGCDSVIILIVDLIPIPGTPIAPQDIVIMENEPPFMGHGPTKGKNVPLFRSLKSIVC